MIYPCDQPGQHLDDCAFCAELSELERTLFEILCQPAPPEVGDYGDYSGLVT